MFKWLGFGHSSDLVLIPVLKTEILQATQWCQKKKITTCNHRWKIWPRAPGPHLLPWELLGIQEDSRWISALLSIRSANAASAMTQERESWSLSSVEKSICNHPCMFQLLGPLWHLPAALASSPKYFLYIMTMTLFSSKSTDKYVFSHKRKSCSVVSSLWGR